jgi:DNA-binding IclR family transcriptional regulator
LRGEVRRCQAWPLKRRIADAICRRTYCGKLEGLELANGKVQGAQSFARSMMVLQLIADAPHPPGVGELMDDGGLTRPTLYRILASLEAEGLVRQTAAKNFVLGSRLIGLAHRALAQNDIRAVAQDELAALRDATTETVHLAVRNLDEMVYIDKIESQQIVRMASGIGTRVPFHSSSVGRAFLAALSEGEAQDLINRLQLNPMTKRTPTKQKRLQKLIEDTRSCGYSHDDEENESGIVCFGAPILDAEAHPIASVSVSVPSFRLDKNHERYWKPLIRCCASISTACGHLSKPS